MITVGGLILFGFLFVIAFGERGAIDLYQLKLEKNRIHKANLALQKKNHAAYRTIQRLKHDPEFVENIARTELGMVGKNEVVILRKRK